MSFWQYISPFSTHTSSTYSPTDFVSSIVKYTSSIYTKYKLRDGRIIYTYSANTSPVHPYNVRLITNVCLTDDHVLSLDTKLTYVDMYWLNPLYVHITMLGSFQIIPTQPFRSLLIVGTIIIIHTQPNNYIFRKYAYFLRYRSIKAIQALKSPKYGRTLKSVATAAISTVSSVNPLSRTNCRIRRTFMPRPTKKVEIWIIALLLTQYAE